MLANQQKCNLRMPTEEYLNRFLLHLSGFRPSTQESYTRVINRFASSAPDYISQITPETIEKFILSQKNQGMKSSSCNLSLMVIKSLFTWLENTYDVPNKARKVKSLRTLPPKQRPLTPEEYLKIKEIPDGYVKATVLFLCNTGLRSSEFLNIYPENISGSFITFVSTKTYKEVFVPINTTVRAILEAYPRLNFIKSRNRPWLFRTCRKAADYAKIKPYFSAHSCRHYFVTRMVANGVPRSTVAKIVGDTVETIDKVYVHLSNNDLLGSTDCLD